MVRWFLILVCANMEYFYQYLLYYRRSWSHLCVNKRLEEFKSVLELPKMWSITHRCVTLIMSNYLIKRPSFELTNYEDEIQIFKFSYHQHYWFFDELTSEKKDFQFTLILKWIPLWILFFYNWYRYIHIQTCRHRGIQT